MATKKLRIILDTNWYISATINKNSRLTLYKLLINKDLTIIYSSGILAEYKSVITRNKFKKIVETQQISKFMELVISRLENVEVKADLEGSRDPNDNFLLSLSFDSKADYLITGDTDLLILKMTGSTQIITLPVFLEITSRKTL